MFDSKHEEIVEAAHKVAAEVFGFRSFRPGQIEVIRDVLTGQPVITVMPTGAGKSLCYQLPAVMLAGAGGFTLVVSPLIALMKDQVDGLRARGIEAAALTSAVDPSEQSAILDGIRAGLFTLVYVAPERFRSPRFLDALAEVRSRLALLAIDEAHCISEWGHDFRPDYRRMSGVIAKLAPPRLLALTATATPEVRSDICEQLQIPNAQLYVRGFDRPNLYLAVEQAGGFADKSRRLIDRVQARKNGVALVYAATRKNAERYAEALQAEGMRAAVYHAGLEDAARTGAQEAFMTDQLDAIVATNAFGMGVDKSDIRVVVHADIPRSPEAYYQEAGRGGRDGGQTSCVILFNHSDLRLQEFLIDSSYPSAELLRGLWKLLREQPQLGGHELARLRAHLPGEPHESVLRSAVRILLRHGFLREDVDVLLAVRPDESEGYPPLDVDELARRADVERRKLRTMIEYAYYPRCRRQFVLDYFGDIDWRDREQRCSGCDNCLGQGQAQAMSEEQKRAARGLLGLVQALSGRFGRTRLTALANGTDDDARFMELPERGVLRGQGTRPILDLLRALEGAGLIDASRSEYPTISITRRGVQVLDGTLDLDEIGLLVASRRSSSRAGSRSSSRAGKKATPEPEATSADAAAPDPDVVERLRALRTTLAAEKSVPAFVIFSNKTMDAIARAFPRSSEELAAVPGIGPAKLSDYGEKILAALNSG